MIEIDASDFLKLADEIERNAAKLVAEITPSMERGAVKIKTAMRDELERQRDTIRQLRKLNDILHREADEQAATIQQLRDDIDDWRNRYLRAIAGERGKA